MSSDTTGTSALAELRRKYSAVPDARTSAGQSFGRRQAVPVKPLGRAPVTAAESNEMKEIYATYGLINTQIIQIISQYKDIKGELREAIKANTPYTLSERARLLKYTVQGKKNEAIALQSEAFSRKGQSIGTLVHGLEDVVARGYQLGLDSKNIAQQTLEENITKRTTFYDKLLVSYKSGFTNQAQMSAAEQEVKRMQGEQAEFDRALKDYQGKIELARANGNYDEVIKLTNEAAEVVDMQRMHLEGTLAAEGKVSDLRRDILDAIATKQEAEGAIIASRVNYKMLTGLVDAANELIIMYRNAQDFLIPLMDESAKITAMVYDLDKMKNDLETMANSYAMLVQVNSQYVKQVQAKAFERLKQGSFDIKGLLDLENSVDGFQAGLNEAKKEYIAAREAMQASALTNDYTEQK